MDVNASFNEFLNTFLVIFESCFPMQYVVNTMYKNQWITNGIRVSCRRKKYLYMISRVTRYPKIKEYYARYCSILRTVISKAKEMYYNEMLTDSTNKSQVSWKIINNEIGHVTKRKFVPLELKYGEQNICTNKAAEFFNTYFINSVDNLISQYPKNEGDHFTITSSIIDKFPDIVNIPITSAEVLSSIFFIKE